jgi:hypothetical protein
MMPFCEDVPFDQNPDYPLGANDDLRKTGTNTDFNTVFLQRLADPTIAWNPLPGEPGHDTNAPLNPYITIDWSTIDLTVYNGEDKKPDAWDPNEMVGDPPMPIGEWDEDDVNPYGSNPPERFSTRMRGQDTFAAAPNIFPPHTKQPATTAGGAAAPDGDIFTHTLGHTLGYLNTTYGPYMANPPAYVGDPQVGPFPWLVHHNRPFANAMELLQVPSSSPSRLLFEMQQFVTVGDAANAPRFNGNRYAAAGNNVLNFRAPYGHLLNFFHTTNAKQPANAGADLYHLLDFVEVPSRYVGAERWYNPAQFIPTNTPATDALTATYRPPFNHLSRFRAPGKVNINTIFDKRVWKAMTYGFPDSSLADHWDIWAQIDNSRRNIPGVTGTLPTEFPGVFRSASAGTLVPLTGANGTPDMRVDGIQASLLREGTGGRPLFSFPQGSLNEPYRNHERNSYFHYQGLQKIESMITTQSNTFAVWLTVGFFEVEPNPPPGQPTSLTPTIDYSHPDGYRLAQELGTDTGEIKRHRAFYIIDRSIPVCFEPGENHNVDRAVLVRRFIE